MSFTSKDKKAVLNGLWEGTITARKLPVEVYLKTSKVLKASVTKGVAGHKGEIVSSLKENMDMFSAAKTFQQTLDMQSLFVAGMTEEDYKELAGQTFDLYNTTYLEAENNSVLLQSQNAKDWIGIEENKDVLPLLRYSAIVDDNTSEICLQCDGVTLPVDDPFWDMYSPENHYNCRCLLEQLDDEHSEVQPGDNLEKPDPVFDNNVGKTGEIFNKDHPYFNVPSGYKEFAKDNFGLPL